jgi:hypothetical protein
MMIIEIYQHVRTFNVYSFLLKFAIPECNWLKLLSIREKMAVGFGKFPFFNFLYNVGFLKNLFLGFYDCCSLKLHFGQIFEILTFDFGVKFAKFPKYLWFLKKLIPQHPLIGKFQN